ncbi:uncharacterized protein PSFLO_05041 [Pseudozyma flocculosa]|nr:uncharacterized protein PSFLO_05041 [Pseudozyma flocculosa]
MLSRLTPPRILAHGLPSYRHSFSLPEHDSSAPSSSSSADADLAHDGDRRSHTFRQPRPPRYVDWNSLVPSPQALLSSFTSLLRPTVEPDVQPAPPPPRLVFFGEQHHQPEVLRAQLQTLSALDDHCRHASLSSTPGKRGTLYRLHLVLEHFSVEDQPMLNSFYSGSLAPQGLIDAYSANSQEGFDLSHYMPLLLLARELRVPIWGGFPPRRWARDVFRQGVDAVKLNEQSWLAGAAATSTEPMTAATATATAPGTTTAKSAHLLPRLSNWSLVTQLHAAHRAYLSSLMRPDLPPTFPALPAGSASQPLLSAMASMSGSHIYPTWLLRPTASETKGFAPAQALKDSYFAHVTAWILRGCPATPEERSRFVEAEAGGDEKVVNVTLCIAGLGHVEYGMGAPERVIHLLRRSQSPFAQQQRPGDAATSADDAREASAEPYERDPDLEAIEPIIIASKPADSGIWLGFEAPSTPPEVDGSSPATTVQEARPLQRGRWEEDPWQRKLADAVVLYEWRDEEVAPEAEAEVEVEAARSQSTG